MQARQDYSHSQRIEDQVVKQESARMRGDITGKPV
jgi:hypothetical protein